VIAFDWPGLGDSQPWPGGATPYDQAARLERLLDAWEIDRATIVAEDMGGQAALAFAARHPSRIRRLVVMNSLAFGTARTSWEIRILRRFGWNRMLLRHVPGIIFRRCERTFLPEGEALAPELREEFWSRFRRPETRDFIIRMCAGYEGSLARLQDLYPQVRVPTLALWGARDKHFPVEHGERLAAAIPGARLDVVPDGWHWMMLHAAEEVSSRIARFLDAT
jgi:pimeloyl-ACP methyl ester carboxylesterase